MSPEAVAVPARPNAESVAQRIAGATERLAANQDEQVSAVAIEAAGGLERWFPNGTIQFRFRYFPVDRPGPTSRIRPIP